ncbi:hypothetical protein F183_A44920 [Bryobacterales bacterium F-183]|nr:hypothetical protein F183_A44920 [Bryobacterales bacterium F-183]
MGIATAILVFLTLDAEAVTENFTGKVLDGSTSKLLRIERGQDKRRPESIVVVEDCGPADVGSVHEFTVWANSKDAVLACLAIDGKPPVSIQRRMAPTGFGVVFGEVRSIDRATGTAKPMPSASVEVRCGDKIWNGHTDRHGRFWTPLPSGTCFLDHHVDGYRAIDPVPAPFVVREQQVGGIRLRIAPWGIKDRLEELIRDVLPK